jgi:hypothetical protein
LPSPKETHQQTISKITALLLSVIIYYIPVSMKST